MEMENTAASSFSVQATMRDYDECYILTVMFEGMTTEQATWEYSYTPMKVVKIRYPPPVSDRPIVFPKSESIYELVLIIKCPDDAVLLRTKVVYGAFQFCFIIAKVDDPGVDAMLSMFMKSEEQRILKSKAPVGGRLIVSLSTNWRRGLWYYMFNVKLQTLSMEDLFVGGHQPLSGGQRKLSIRHPRNCNDSEYSGSFHNAALSLQLNSPMESELRRLVDMSKHYDDGVTLFIPDCIVIPAQSGESFFEDAFTRMYELDREEHLANIRKLRKAAMTGEEPNNDEMNVIKEQKQGLVQILAADNHGCFYVSNVDHINVILDHLGDRSVPVQVASSVENEHKVILQKQIVKAGLKLYNDGDGKDVDC